MEDKWYRLWEESGHFSPASRDKEPYCIVIPPPNITSNLHMGHALDNTLQDILIRWKRMNGFNALWIPGVDHAGIATQNVVEKELLAEGTSRDELGRKDFLNRVWEWRKKYGTNITSQLRRMGSSCDWKYERFTMDEGCSRAVRYAFVSLYKQGLVYRGNRIINWCPRCQTALSDIEVEYTETEGKLFYIKYPCESSYVSVATTRPETMLGDTAVAVHPEDVRYRELQGKELALPLTGRQIPVIADTAVDPSFGTGAVKITPAHDRDDFEIGSRHKLNSPIVIGKDGRMSPSTGKFAGLSREEAREKVIKELTALCLLTKTEPHTHSVGHCYRCQTVIEPLLSEQWFVKMEGLKGPAINAVKAGDVRFIPERWKGVYLNWMDGLKDWCISRQIWWGHQIPVFYCNECGESCAAETDPSHCPSCGSKGLRQDEDVLDTWFSSSLWPLSTLGWPRNSDDFAHFYPTSTLVTGYDIICFWVARMIMMGLFFTGKSPFREVYIHGLIRDASGKKMSKSLGNVVDPLNIIDNFGADALRFSLAWTATLGGQDIFFTDELLKGMRNFTNKLWNASNFITANLPDEKVLDEKVLEGANRNDRWIMSAVNELIRDVDKGLGGFKFSESAKLLHEFIWHSFCDWYLEMAKLRLNEKTTLFALRYTWGVVLRLLHPFMPFITEEMWHALTGGKGGSIMIESWPAFDEQRLDREASAEVQYKQEIVYTCRSLKADNSIPPQEAVCFIIKPKDTKEEGILKEDNEELKKFLRASQLIIDRSITPDKGDLSGVSEKGTLIYLRRELPGKGADRARIEKEIAEISEKIKRSLERLSNPDFIKKAPPEVVEKEKKRLKEWESKSDSYIRMIK